MLPLDGFWRLVELDGAQALVLMSLSLSCALVGTWLVLRKMTMLANSISHTVLLGIVAAWMIDRYLGGHTTPSMGLLMICASAVSALTNLSTYFFHRILKLQEDASIGLVFSGLFALGILSLSWAFPRSHIGTEVIMGNADAIGWHDLSSSVTLLGMNGLILWLLHKEYRLSTFDRQLASSMGFYPFLLDFLLMTQLTLTIMVGFRAVGSFLVLALLVGPVLCARLVTHRLSSLMLLAGGIAVSSAFLACMSARLLLDTTGVAISTAGLLCSLLLLVFLLLGLYHGLLRAYHRQAYRK